MELNSKSKPEVAEGAENPASTGANRLAENEFTDKIIGAAIEVHRHLGPGLLESAYEECLCYELSQMGLRFERQVKLPITYKGIQLASAHRLDLLVEDAVIVEIKATEPNEALHCAQLLTYLKSSGKRVGLLINFNVPVLKKGIKRVVNHFCEPGPTRDVSAPSAAEPREKRTSDFSDESSPLISQRFPRRLCASASTNEPSPNSREPGPTRDVSAPSAAEPREKRMAGFSDESSSLMSQRLPQRLCASASNNGPAPNKEPM